MNSTALLLSTRTGIVGDAGNGRPVGRIERRRIESNRPPATIVRWFWRCHCHGHSLNPERGYARRRDAFDALADHTAGQIVAAGQAG